MENELMSREWGKGGQCVAVGGEKRSKLPWIAGGYV